MRLSWQGEQSRYLGCKDDESVFRTYISNRASQRLTMVCHFTKKEKKKLIRHVNIKGGKNIQSYAVYTFSNHFCPIINCPGPPLAIHVLTNAPLSTSAAVTLSEGYSSFGTMYCDGGIENSIRLLPVPRVNSREGRECVALLGKERKPLRALLSKFMLPL
jgi:hypothetical protein